MIKLIPKTNQNNNAPFLALFLKIQIKKNYYADFVKNTNSLNQYFGDSGLIIRIRRICNSLIFRIRQIVNSATRLQFSEFAESLTQKFGINSPNLLNHQLGDSALIFRICRFVNVAIRDLILQIYFLRFGINFPNLQNLGIL